VIERYDCSGAGDVDTSTIVKISSDGFITTLSGRKLKVSEEKPDVSEKNSHGSVNLSINNSYFFYRYPKLGKMIRENTISVPNPCTKSIPRKLKSGLRKNVERPTGTHNIE